jgi:UDP-2,4-diacetamido-2,4,6-trideoxy-beta-L-altropyranose hydrolase
MKVIIRVNFFENIGGGHFMRMIALAQKLKRDDFEVFFMVICSNKILVEEFLQNKFNVIFQEEMELYYWETDLNNLISFANKIMPAFIVIDGYKFSYEYEIGIKSAGFKLMKVDDLPRQKCCADILLNQNHGSNNFNHDTSDNTLSLFGLKYLLIRDEFTLIDLKKKNKLKKKKVKLLIILSAGSKITDNINLLLLKALVAMKNTFENVTLIVGKMGTISNELLKFKYESDFKLNILQNLNNVSYEMFNADIAITAGGSTMWELMYTQTPFVTISLNKDQLDYTTFLEKERLSINLGMYTQLTEEIIQNKISTLINDEEYRSSIINKSDFILDRNNNWNNIKRAIEKKLLISN